MPHSDRPALYVEAARLIRDIGREYWIVGVLMRRGMILARVALLGGCDDGVFGLEARK